MLITALCDYYDALAKKGAVMPSGVSQVDVSYLIALESSGNIAEIIDYRKKETETNKNGKTTEKYTPRVCLMPQRESKSGTNSELLDHRAMYFWGLEFTKSDGLQITSKAQKSHEAFVKKHLTFLEGIDTPIVNAYRNHIINWSPKTGKENPFILGIGKGYTKKFAFCLAGRPDILLHEDPFVKKRAEEYLLENSAEENTVRKWCAITGEQATIARLHNKINGIIGGQTSGMVLVCFNNPSEESYGEVQSYNSNVSEEAMKKYTEALNYLLADKKHRTVLDETTVVFWAMSEKEQETDLFNMLMLQSNDKMDEVDTDNMLAGLFADAKNGTVVKERLCANEHIDENVDFYIVGIKPNASRLAVKFLYRKRFGEILANIAQLQIDFQVGENRRPLAFWQIKQELRIPKSKNDMVNPALLAKIMEAVFYDRPLPIALLDNIIRRIKTDTDDDKNKYRKMNTVRIGILKACINRLNRANNEKEEIKMSLDKENKNQAYLCGRLFAVLEREQELAAGVPLNRTIKDAYFASAAARPAVIFPKLLQLAQHHMKKVEKKTKGMAVNLEKLQGNIINALTGEFASTLPLIEQGKFIIGYYQQRQSFFEKQDKNGDVKEEEK